ncbi:MAG: hypothetical protein CMP20_01805 [Rickettsiales bacterium]|nr:hypothetical protein [Rickettsiales bacterium]
MTVDTRNLAERWIERKVISQEFVEKFGVPDGLRDKEWSEIFNGLDDEAFEFVLGSDMDAATANAFLKITDRSFPDAFVKRFFQDLTFVNNYCAQAHALRKWMYNGVDTSTLAIMAVNAQAYSKEQADMLRAIWKQSMLKDQADRNFCLNYQWHRKPRNSAFPLVCNIMSVTMQFFIFVLVVLMFTRLMSLDHAVWAVFDNLSEFKATQSQQNDVLGKLTEPKPGFMFWVGFIFDWVIRLWIDLLQALVSD